jgi:hypothetical protein
MKFDFEILKKASSEQKLKVSEFEIQFKLTLPPIYKLFCQVFELSRFKFEMYSESGDGQDLNYCSQVYYKPKGKYEDNIGITGLDNIETVFNNWKKMIGYGEDDKKSNLLRIAGIGRGGAIFVGYGKQNLDEIILHLWEEDPGYEKLANNIFDFVNDIVSEPLSEEDYPEINYSDLYKNWGEDFWRVRNESNA